MATFLSYISWHIRSDEKKRPEIHNFHVLLLFTDAGLGGHFWGESALWAGGKDTKERKSYQPNKAGRLRWSISFEHNMIVCCLWIWNDIYKIWWTWLHNPSSPPSLPKSHMAPLEPLAPTHTLHFLYSTLHIFYFSTLHYFSHTPLLYFCTFLSLNQPHWVFSFSNKSSLNSSSGAVWSHF